MKIGIVGVGVVGGAIKHGFQKLGHEIFEHDIVLDTKLSDVVPADIVYITVPTPQGEEGYCDTSIVESVVSELLNVHKYDGIIAIKSTAAPGTTQKLIDKYSNNKICFVPEFLRERYAASDFTENHDLCIIGTYEEEVYEKVKLSHGKLPKMFARVSPTEAELCKYFNNTYNATLITFANSFKRICDYYGVDYSNVKNTITNRNHIKDIYLESNDHFKGFSGMCLPKDTSQLARVGKEIGVGFFQMLIEENDKYEKIVQDGMRG